MSLYFNCAFQPSSPNIAVSDLGTAFLDRGGKMYLSGLTFNISCPPFLTVADRDGALTVPKIMSYEPVVGLRDELGNVTYFKMVLDDWYEPSEVLEIFREIIKKNGNLAQVRDPDVSSIVGVV